MKNIKRFYKGTDRKRFPSPCRLATIVALLLISIAGLSQNPVMRIFEDWHDTSGTQNTFQKSVVRSKGLGGTTYYYVAGATINSSGNYDMLVEKLNSTGTVLWSKIYNGAGNGDDVATDVQIDGVGNVYICGTYYKNSTDSNNAVIIKYNSAGTQKWIYTFNGTGSKYDGLATMAISANGNAIFAAGATWAGSTTLYDMFFMRLDSSGSQIWQNTWNYGTANLNDAATNMYAVGTRFYLAGGAQSSTTNYKYAVLYINLTTGSVNSSTVTGGTGFGIDRVADVQTDATGNFFVTGSVFNATSLYDFKTIKLDTALNIVWSATYDGGSNLNDFGTGLKVDANNNVIVTGCSRTASNGYDYTTIKYNSAGTQKWVTNYDGGINADDSATAIVVGDTNHIYVTGYSYNGSTNDYYTLRYDASGNEVLGIGFNSIQNADDRASAIALDTNGNVIVTGQNEIDDTTFTYTTVKYVEKSTTLPQDTIAATSNSFVFTENRGQLYGTDSTQHPEIKYYTIHGAPNVYLADTSLSYVLPKINSTTAVYDSIVRVDMKFVGANSDLKLRASELVGGYSNFYNGVPGGREHVQNFNQLVSFNVWNNVDLIYGSNLKGLKYYFICKPVTGGTSYASIDLKYVGADSVKIDGSGQLVIYTRLGNIVQPKAAAWQLNTSGNFSSLGWQPSYNIVATNEVKFTGLGSYNSSLPLIFAIDQGNVTPQSIQNLNWSTYIGGDAREDLADLDVRQTDGSIYYTGMTMSTNFPVQNASQNTNMGGFDAVAIKLDSTCNYLLSTDWATYYGSAVPSFGSSQYGTAGAVAANGNYFVGGTTNYFGSVKLSFPTSQPAGAYVDTTYGGGSADAFIVEFDRAYGTLLWGTYYGGAGSSTMESVNDLTFDSDGNLIVLLRADTATPRMIETGAYNNATKPGGMILKFDSTLARKWATCFSTTGGTTKRIVCETTTGNFFVTGQATDSLLPLVNPGSGAYFDDTLGGTSDAYIAKFNSADTLTWCTYFGGAGAEDGVAIDVFVDELYVGGTTSSTDFPYYFSGTCYKDSVLTGSGDMFISHFKTIGQLNWATYYGGSSTETAGNFAFDLYGNMYMTANTLSSNFTTLNPSNNIYYDGSFGGGTVNDVALLSFNSTNQLKWSTYFGGLKNDACTQGIGIYQNEWLYISGSTETKSTDNPSFPITQLSGAYWQPTMPNAITNSFMSRFGLDPIFTIGIGELQQADIANNSWLLVYPNPSDGEFSVMVNSESKNRKIEVYNTLGQLLQSIPIADGMASRTISLNLKEQPTGVYFIVLTDESGLLSKKVIRQ